MSHLLAHVLLWCRFDQVEDKNHYDNIMVQEPRYSQITQKGTLQLENFEEKNLHTAVSPACHEHWYKCADITAGTTKAVT